MNNEIVNNSLEIPDLEIDAAPAGSAGSVVIEIILVLWGMNAL
jgi:hypothetical protein